MPYEKKMEVNESFMPPRQFVNISEVSSYMMDAREIYLGLRAIAPSYEDEDTGIEFGLRGIGLGTADEPVIRRQPFTSYDFDILDSVYTLMRNGCDCFTPVMVIHTFAGYPEYSTTQLRIDEVKRIIEKLSQIEITICAEDAGEITEMTGLLLPVEKAVLSFPRRAGTKEGYHLTENPVLYRYAEMRGQVPEIPAALFGKPGTIGKKTQK